MGNWASVTFRTEDDVYSTYFQCRLDSEPFTSCWSPWEVYNLSPGQHTVEIRAIDGAGNLESPPAARSFAVAGTPEPSPSPSPSPYDYATPTPTPSPTPSPAPRPTAALTATPAAGTPVGNGGAFPAPPSGYRVVAPEDDQFVATPDELRAALRDYLRACRVRTLAKRLRVTVPYLAAATGMLEVRLVVAGRTVARSRLGVTAGTLAWPRLGVASGRRALLRRSRGGELVVVFDGAATKSRVRWLTR